MERSSIQSTNDLVLSKLLLLLIRGEFSQLYYHAWLRLHRLDISHVNFVAKSDGQPYSNSGGPYLAKVLKTLNIQKANSVLLEFGVGKGIACLTFSRYFDRIIGVDLSAELIDIARKNMAKMGITNVEFHAGDARTFNAGLDDVTHIYMFNPFSREVTARVIENLKLSLARRPRRIMLIFLAPYTHEMFVAAGFQHQRDFDFDRNKSIQDRFSVYEINHGVTDSGPTGDRSAHSTVATDASPGAS